MKHLLTHEVRIGGKERKKVTIQILIHLRRLWRQGVEDRWDTPHPAKGPAGPLEPLQLSSASL